MIIMTHRLESPKNKGRYYAVKTSRGLILVNNALSGEDAKEHVRRWNVHVRVNSVTPIYEQDFMQMSWKYPRLSWVGGMVTKSGFKLDRTPKYGRNYS
jgi:hypothetical protein